VIPPAVETDLDIAIARVVATRQLPRGPGSLLRTVAMLRLVEAEVDRMGRQPLLRLPLRPTVYT